MESTALLGVEEMVARESVSLLSVLRSCRHAEPATTRARAPAERAHPPVQGHVLVGGPVHQVVAAEHGRQPVEDLGLGAAEGVEDGVVGGAGKGVLAVGRETPVDDALLLVHATCDCQ